MTQSSVKFESLFRQTPTLLMVLEPREFRIVEASESYLKATMRKREQVVGHLLFDAYPSDPADPSGDSGTSALNESLQEVLATKQPHTMSSVRYPIERPAAEGGGFEERYWQVTNSPVFDDDGNISYILHAPQDVTQRVIAERGAELTNRLLAFARRQPLEPKPTQVNELLDSMLPLIRRTLSESVEVAIVTDPSLWLADIDPAQFESVILNLSINARDAMSEGGGVASGKLIIESRNVQLDEDYSSAHGDVVPGDYVLVSVSDTGTGMTPEVMQHAFEPFFTTKDRGKGSGLGLSMVYGYAKQSNGHIKIYSELQHGTTIKLYLPRAMAAADAVSASAVADAPQGGRERILIVEDDALVRQHVIIQLSALGYEIEAASSGQEALSMLEHERFDLLFTDVVMPGGINGPQLAAQAQELYPQMKVLFTSGYTENAIVHHGRLDAGVHLLSKPYRRQDLANKVREVLLSP